jgi:hypothetical protein
MRLPNLSSSTTRNWMTMAAAPRGGAISGVTGSSGQVDPCSGHECDENHPCPSGCQCPSSTTKKQQHRCITAPPAH